MHLLQHAQHLIDVVVHDKYLHGSTLLPGSHGPGCGRWCLPPLPEDLARVTSLRGEITWRFVHYKGMILCQQAPPSGERRAFRPSIGAAYKGALGLECVDQHAIGPDSAFGMCEGGLYLNRDRRGQLHPVALTRNSDE